MGPVALIFLTTIVAQTNTAIPKPAFNAPTATGAPHTCADYPAGAMQTLAEGATTVAFKITQTGSVSDASVQTSSGNAYLDNAAVACTKDWQYRAATAMDGSPIIMPWKVQIRWNIHPSPPFDIIDDAAYRCVQSTDAGREEMSQAKLHTVVRVHFKNGDIAGVSVASPSGNADLDRRVAECYGRVAPAATVSLQDDLYEPLTPIPAEARTQ
jgi:TonB family protein